MKKKINISYRFNRFEAIYFVLVLIMISLGLVLAHLNHTITQKYNLEKTSIDFIIPSPSSEQVNSLAQDPSIDTITPYYFFSFSINGMNSLADGYILESFDSLNHTYVADDLIIKSEALTENSVLIDSVFASKNGLDLGDEMTLSFAGESFQFQVSVIVASDNRHNFGMLLIEMNDSIHQAMSNQYSGNLYYGGAFIDSNHFDDTQLILEDYVPLGNLRTRESFSSDELYDTYIDQLYSADYSLQIFNRNDYLNQIRLQTANQISLNQVMGILLVALGTIALASVLLIKSYYFFKNNYLSDLEDGYSEADQKRMFDRYSLNMLSRLLILVSIPIVICYVFEFNYYILHNLNIYLLLSLTIPIAMNHGYLIHRKNQFRKKQTK